MNGMNMHTGKKISGEDYLRQRIAKIITTPIGTRVCNRLFGCRIPGMVDDPVGIGSKTDLYSAAADALNKWEPEIIVDALSVEPSPDGQMQLSAKSRRVVTGQPVFMDGIFLT